MINETSGVWELPVLPASAFDPNFDKLDFRALAEAVAITDGGGEAVPHPAAPSTAPAQWPDFAARRRDVFGGAVLPAGTAQALVNEDRGA